MNNQGKYGKYYALERWLHALRVKYYDLINFYPEKVEQIEIIKRLIEEAEQEVKEKN